MEKAHFMLSCNEFKAQYSSLHWNSRKQYCMSQVLWCTEFGKYIAWNLKHQIVCNKLHQIPPCNLFPQFQAIYFLFTFGAIFWPRVGGVLELDPSDCFEHLVGPHSFIIQTIDGAMLHYSLIKWMIHTHYKIVTISKIFTIICRLYITVV